MALCTLRMALLNCYLSFFLCPKGSPGAPGPDGLTGSKGSMVSGKESLTRKCLFECGREKKNYESS